MIRATAGKWSTPVEATLLRTVRPIAASYTCVFVVLLFNLLTLLDLRVSSLRRGHANLLRLVPIVHGRSPKGIPQLPPPALHR